MAPPQDYWNEYGHVFYSKYAPKSDTVFVIVLLLVVFSIFGPVAQRSKYHHACSFLITAAIKNWSLREGGTKEVRACVGRSVGRVHLECCWFSYLTDHTRLLASLRLQKQNQQTQEIRRRALEQVRAKKGE